jgi:two-component system, chemotaxis family, protein-glutamate methylesterase/glutaminase
VPDKGCDVVVVGASAGGVEALTLFASALPPDFPVPVLVVLHVPPTGLSVLPDILSRAGPLRATHADDGEELAAGHLYVAPPNSHLLVNDGKVELTRGPVENGHRPAIDPLFRSAAAVYDSRAVGVVLSGALDDGTAGLYAIKQAGGATLVQDPAEALYPGMPSSAIAYAQPDYVLPVGELVEQLVELTSTPNGGRLEEEAMTEPAPNPSSEDAQPGELAPFSCPDCGGTLWENQQGEIVHYRCRIGHAYTAQSLIAKHSEAVERAMWSAYRALEERSAMLRRTARRMNERGHAEPAARFERQAEVVERQGLELKSLLEQLEIGPDDEAIAG